MLLLSAGFLQVSFHCHLVLLCRLAARVSLALPSVSCIFSSFDSTWRILLPVLSSLCVFIECAVFAALYSPFFLSTSCAGARLQALLYPVLFLLFVQAQCLYSTCCYSLCFYCDFAPLGSIFTSVCAFLCCNLPFLSLLPSCELCLITPEGAAVVGAAGSLLLSGAVSPPLTSVPRGSRTFRAPFSLQPPLWRRNLCRPHLLR